jgi:hypothetical protein
MSESIPGGFNGIYLAKALANGQSIVCSSPDHGIWSIRRSSRARPDRLVRHSCSRKSAKHPR